MTSPHNPFRPAARVMLFSAVVSFAAAGAAAFLWMSPGHVPAGVAAGSVSERVPPPAFAFVPPSANAGNRPAIDGRRLAANDPQPGVFGDAAGGVHPPTFQRPLHSAGHLDDHPTAHTDHARPVPDPQLAFVEEPTAAAGRTADVETRPFPGRENGPAPAEQSASATPASRAKPPAVEDRSHPLVQVIGLDSDGLKTELRDLRRAFDDLSRVEVSEQTRELKRIRRRLAELETAPAVEGLRDSIRDLQTAMAAQHAETVARIEELKEQASLQAAVLEQQPAGPISVTPGSASETWTIHLVDARLPTALQTIATRAGLNVVSPPDLDVPVNATLSDVTAQDAIASLVSAYGKTIRQEGRFVRIEPAPAFPVEPMDLPAPAVPLPVEPAAVPEVVAAPLSLITPPAAGTPELRTQVFRLRHFSRAVAEPIVRTMLSPDGAILDSSDELSLDPAILRTSLIVRDAEPTLSAVAKYLAVTDVPRTAVEIEVKVLSVELRDRAERGVRQSLNDLMAQTSPKAPVCPKCGRRHTRTEILGPECILAEPTWSTRGEGWDLAQFRGRPSDFVTAFQTTLPIAELAAPRMRVASDSQAVLRLRDLILESPRSDVATVAFENAGDSVDIIAKPLDDERVELVLNSSAVQQGGAASHADESSLARKASVTVQSGCTVVLAGVRMESASAQVVAGHPAARASANNASRSRKEVVILVCPRIVEDQPAAN
ncbi:hypothetical protein [Planctomyces sp. SH-PL14]|uniref:hypothetical protein n=1 Tax=Planctomyces sp. SH-PL14 TaxID=1632864 RepID=UPI00078BD49A|nr:hypothetical protein [Planctomyces sp. SH-PL14]AMV22739.1 outer membrane porin HofQ [Planctomyces sp. SH-PL14]